MLAVVTVDTDVDVVDFRDGVTSLREAVFATNIVPGADEIVFDFGHDGPAVIFLEQGELEITEALTITGDGPDLLTIDAQQNSRIFNIDDGDDGADSPVTISGLTLTGGAVDPAIGGAIWTKEALTVASSRISGNSAFRGGGIYADGDVTVTSSTISGNSARAWGGGISSSGNVMVTSCTVSGNRGSGILAFGNVTVTTSTITENSADFGGGGISSSGNVTVTNSTISDNSARGAMSVGGKGGGICARNGDVTVTNSTISGTVAWGRQGYGCDEGGGIFTNGSVTVTNSTISGNSADSGAGIRAFGDVTVTNSTISDNLARHNGGGIRTSGEVTIRSSTISGNSAQWDIGGGIYADGDVTLAIENSIVAGNTDNGTAPDIRPGSGALTVRYSLIGDNTGTGMTEAPIGAPDANGNLIGGPINGPIDPLLGPLGDNGGPTETHALLAGSPVIDAGDPLFSPPPAHDQRGVPRVQDGDLDGTSRIDMGAYELLLGDVNGDGQVSDQDVAPFLEVLLSGPYNPAADMTQDGTVNGLDCDPLMAAVASAAAGTMQESTSDQGLDVAVDEIDVTSTTLPKPTTAELPKTIATELPRGRRFSVDDQKPLGRRPDGSVIARDDELSRRLQRTRHDHTSHDGDERPQLIRPAAVERVFAEQLRPARRYSRDAHRSAPEDVLHQLQLKPISDWQAAVDRAFENSTGWIR